MNRAHLSLISSITVLFSPGIQFFFFFFDISLRGLPLHQPSSLLYSLLKGVGVTGTAGTTNNQQLMNSIE